MKVFLFLVVLVTCVAMTMGLKVHGLPEDAEVLGIQKGECRWLCGEKGDFLECDFDEISFGMCGSQSWANCESNTYCPGTNPHHALQCCKAEVLVQYET